MSHSAEIRVGDRVEVLRPEYAAGKIGILIARETLDNRSSDRWLVRLEDGDILLSIAPEDFRILS